MDFDNPEVYGDTLISDGLVNDEHEGTDVIFSIKIFLTTRPGTQTFWQVPDPSRPKAKKHYTSGPS